MKSMRTDEGSRKEDERNNLQDTSPEGIFATPAPNSATGQSQQPPWRTEPEIGLARQEQLARCLATSPDIRRGIYPFRGMKLNRADVEWLLVTQENGRVPTAAGDGQQQKRQGLDLRA